MIGFKRCDSIRAIRIGIAQAMLGFGIVYAVPVFIGIDLRNAAVAVVQIAREQSAARADIRQAFVAAVGIIFGKVARIIGGRYKAAVGIHILFGDAPAERRAGQLRFLDVAVSVVCIVCSQAAVVAVQARRLGDAVAAVCDRLSAAVDRLIGEPIAV